MLLRSISKHIKTQNWLEKTTFSHGERRGNGRFIYDSYNDKRRKQENVL